MSELSIALCASVMTVLTLAGCVPPKPCPTAPLPATEAPSPPAATAGGEFDAGAANTAIKQAQTRAKPCACGEEIYGRMRVSFTPSGHVDEVVMLDQQIPDTTMRECIRSAFLEMRIPSFTGPAPVKVNFGFRAGR